MIAADNPYKSLFKKAPVGILQFSGSGEVLLANPFLIEMLGYDSEEELKEHTVEQIFFSLDFQQFKETVGKKGKLADFETEWKKKAGEKIIVKINSVYVPDSQTDYYDCFVEAITERNSGENIVIHDGLFGQWVFDSSIIPIVILDFETNRVIKLNEAAVKILGFKSEKEVLGIHPEEVFAEKQHDGSLSIEKIKYYFNKAITDGNVTFEWLHKRPNGVLWNGEVNLLFFQSEGKHMFQLSLIDISERKLAEEGLRKSRQLFDTLAQAAPVGIFRTRADGYTTYVNPRWTEISGLSFDRALGDGWLHAVHPEDKELLDENWKKYSSKGKASKANYRFLKPDGEIVWVLGNAVPEIFDGKIIGYVGTITDITEIINSEQELKESEEKYRSIIEAFPDIIMISDLNNNILFANEALYKLTGITREDFNNPNRKPQIHPDDFDRVQRAIIELLKSDKKHTEIIENRFIDAWGKEHWFSGTVSKLKLKNQVVLQTISRDITQKKIVEEELEEYRNQLEYLVKKRTDELAETNQELTVTNEELLRQREELETALEYLKKAQSQLVQAEKMASLGLLASGIAHEINNPLNFIKGGFYALKNYFEANLPEHLSIVLSFLEAISTGTNRAADIVESLNHYSRQNDTAIIDCDIHSIIDNCLVILQSQTKNRIKILKYYTNVSYVLTVRCNAKHSTVKLNQ
jgi:PAS domain S-box-containing protein